LLRVQAQLYREEIPLAEVGLFAKLNATDLAAIEPYLQHASYRRDEVIFREGDPGSEVFIVTKGTASAFLHSSPFNIRLGTFAPGTAFGELAILDAGPHSATVIADEDLACFVLTAPNFAILTEKHPDVAGRVLAAIGRELSGRLRTANRDYPSTGNVEVAHRGADPSGGACHEQMRVQIYPSERNHCRIAR
jgi:SulP family sulfate permease